MALSTPIVFIIFNRPEHTARVFAEIARAQPKRLYLIADGSRVDRPDEAALCAATRATAERIDWDCEVIKHYSEVNLGAGRRPATGISWVFEREEAAIILEDDCLPHPAFFHFCEELLAYYLDDERVMMISGDNFALQWESEKASYHFSKFPATWGWATWRRAWQHYNFSIEDGFEPLNKQIIYDFLEDKRYYDLMMSSFEKVLKHEVATWDYQWSYACFTHGGLTVIPSVNLVSNIGFGLNATHTTKATKKLANLPIFPIEFPLKSPPAVKTDSGYDEVFYRLIRGRSIRRKVIVMFKRLLKWESHRK